jgi:anti-sigma regulatory factor (Ser/Thr protein kinase)
MTKLTISDVERFHRALDRGTPIPESLPGGAELSLAAAAELACILVETPGVMNMVDGSLHSCRMWARFRRMLNPAGPNRIHDDSVLVTKIPFPFDESWFAAEARKFEEALLQSRFPKVLSRSLTGAVFEMVDNVWRHSGSPQHALLAYQVTNRTFSFAVTDTGSGVLNSLRRNRRFAHLKTSIEALEQAIKPNVSADPNGSGLGLDMLARELANLWGLTRLRSGQGALIFNRQSPILKRTHQFLAALNGFQVSAVCRMDPRIRPVDKRS